MRAERPRFGARWQGAASHVPNCMSSFYGADLASVHHTGFAGFARKSARGLLALIHSAGIDDGLVVDLGCGSGVWAGELLRAGYDVLGVDASAAMIRLARSVAPGARFAVGSIQDAVLPPCVAVTAIGEVVTYLDPRRNRGDVSSLFRRVHRALRPGGLFVFDAVERSETDPMHYRARRDGTGWRVIADVFEEPAKSLLTRRITVVRKGHGRERRTEEIHRLQTFSRAELEQPLRTAGFSVRVRRSYGSVRLPPHRMAFVARKPDP